MWLPSVASLSLSLSLSISLFSLSLICSMNSLVFFLTTNILHHFHAPVCFWMQHLLLKEQYMYIYSIRMLMNVIFLHKHLCQSGGMVHFFHALFFYFSHLYRKTRGGSWCQIVFCLLLVNLKCWCVLASKLALLLILHHPAVCPCGFACSYVRACMRACDAGGATPVCPADFLVNSSAD